MVKLNIQNKPSATNTCPPGPQTTFTSVGESPDLFLIPALGLVNMFIPEDALVLIALLDASLGVSQLLRPLRMHLLVRTWAMVTAVRS